MMGKQMRRVVLAVWVACLVVLLVPARSRAASDLQLSKGETVYQPVYSYVFYGDRGRKFDLTATVSIRNTDPHYPITIASAKYYDWQGKMVKEYIAKPLTIAPLASTHLLVNESDLSGGLGACFIIKWKSSQMVNPPLVEAIMIGTGSTQGISFVSKGRVIRAGHE